MNNVADDIAQLSYKELQVLALRYRVPGNIKKKLLVKVLQAARSGDEAEFSRLLQDLRKNRKRKTRKPKDPKLGITSTPLHSPEYITIDDEYYCQQQRQQSQQQSHQWVGAEEEIMSRDEDKIPHYDEFKQFLLKKIQREFQTYDTNNNPDMNIMDLRTATGISPNMEAISLDVPSPPKANLINNADPLATSDMEQPNYQMLREPEGNSQGPFLLKRMLQAPVGANLGEIASSLFWASNLLDNSDTLTAESENEDQLETGATKSTEYYSVLKNAKEEYLLNEANQRNMETLAPRSPEFLINEEQCRYPGELDSRQNYQNCTVLSETEVPESDLQPSKMYHEFYYNTEPAMAPYAADNNMSYQYQANTETCNGNQNFLNFDTGYAADMVSANDTADMIATNDTAEMYYLQNSSKNSEDIRGAEPFVQNCGQQGVYANGQPTYSSDVRSTPEATYQYLYPRFSQETDYALHERLESQQAVNNYGMECGANHDVVNQATSAAGMQGSANGTVELFWPKWTARVSNSLENIFNYNVSRQVDYFKLGQTSCVYCYVAPIVSQRCNLVNNTCSQIRRYTAEKRQHSFSAYWMLYNDTSLGMRMTNLFNDRQPEQYATTRAMMTIHADTTPSNEDLRETNIQAPINDVWMNQYDPAPIAEDTHVQISDPRFCNSSAILTRISDIPMPDIAKT